MDRNTPAQMPISDKILMAVSVSILLGAIYGYYYFADSSQLFRVLGVVGAFVIALLVVAQTAVGRVAISFMIDARMETRKVVWPTKQETTQVTIVVILLVIFVGLILLALDTFLGWVIEALLGT